MGAFFKEDMKVSREKQQSSCISGQVIITLVGILYIHKDCDGNE